MVCTQSLMKMLIIKENPNYIKPLCSYKQERDKPETANTQSLFFKWTVDCFNKFIVTVTAICTN